MAVILLGGRPGTPPNSISGLQFWFSADQGVYSDAGSTLATDTQTCQQWNDFSGNAHHLSQGTAGSRPTYHSSGGSNNQPYLAFDAVDDAMSRTANNDDDLMSATACTMFVIWKYNAAGVGNFPKVFLFYDSGSRLYMGCDNSANVTMLNDDGAADTVTKAGTNNTWQIHSGLHSAGSIYVGKNDTRTASMATGASGNTTIGASMNIYVANYNSAITGMSISEIVYYNVALSESDRVQLEAYYAWKYGIALPY